MNSPWSVAIGKAALGRLGIDGSDRTDQIPAGIAHLQPYQILGPKLIGRESPPFRSQNGQGQAPQSPRGIPIVHVDEGYEQNRPGISDVANRQNLIRVQLEGGTLDKTLRIVGVGVYDDGPVEAVGPADRADRHKLLLRIHWRARAVSPQNRPRPIHLLRPRRLGPGCGWHGRSCPCAR